MTAYQEPNTLCSGDVSGRDWYQLYPSFRPKARPVQITDAAGTIDVVHLNYDGAAQSYGTIAYAVTTPPGATALVLSVPMALPPGVSSGTVTIGWANADGTVNIVMQNCTLAAYQSGQALPVFAATLSSPGVGTEYRAFLITNLSGNQAQALVGAVQVQATSATGMFASAYNRIVAPPHLLWDNARADIHPRFFGASTFARMVLLTTADTFGIEHVSDMYSSAPGQSQLVVRADGRYDATVTPVGNDVLHISTVTLPGGTAEKRVEVISGSQYFAGGSWLRAIYVPASATTRLVEPARDGRRLTVYGDSISCGYFTTLPPLRSWPQLLRPRYGSVTQESSAGRQLHDDGATGTVLVELVRRLSTFDSTDYWLAIGTNDWGTSSWTAAAFGSAYQSLLDSLHAAVPRARIYCQSPLARSGENTPNGNGEVLSAFRTQIQSAAGARPAFATYVDGTAILSLSDLPDGVHPNDATTAKYADYVGALLGC